MVQRLGVRAVPEGGLEDRQGLGRPVGERVGEGEGGVEGLLSGGLPVRFDLFVVGAGGEVAAVAGDRAAPRGDPAGLVCGLLRLA